MTLGFAGICLRLFVGFAGDLVWLNDCIDESMPVWVRSVVAYYFVTIMTSNRSSLSSILLLSTRFVLSKFARRLDKLLMEELPARGTCRLL